MTFSLPWNMRMIEQERRESKAFLKEKKNRAAELEHLMREEAERFDERESEINLKCRSTLTTTYQIHSLSKCRARCSTC